LIVAVVRTALAVVKLKVEKIQAWAGFEPVTSAMPVQCFANWAIKPTESWLFTL